MGKHLPVRLMVICTIAVVVLPAVAVQAQSPIMTSSFEGNARTGFEENKGQISDQFGRARPDVQYSFVQKGFRMRLLRNGVAYELTQSSRVVDGDVHRPVRVDGDVHRPFKTPVEVQRVDVGFAGAAAMPRIETGEMLDGYTNYYYAHLPESGATFVRSYASVTYRDLYEGVDMVVHTLASLDGSTWPVSTDFVVRAGADPAQIRIRFEGARDVRVTAAGELEITTDLGTIREQAPVCRAQLPTGGYVNVGGRFRLDEGEVSFAIDAYPASAILTIDPGLVWATYFGGNGGEGFHDVDGDAGGSVYAFGEGNSTTSIATTGAHKTTITGVKDAMLAKFRSNGTRIWSTYVGGDSDEYGNAVAVAPNGVVFVAGLTTSTSGIATTGAYQTTAGGDFDGYVMRFDSSGVRAWGSYYGGPGREWTRGISVLGTVGVYICGETLSTTGIASAGAHQTVKMSMSDAFLARLSWDGTTRAWGTYYGGTEVDEARAVATDANGYAIIVGSTTSSSGIVSTGAFDSQLVGKEGFIAKFFSTGTRGWGTYLGGAHDDRCTDVAVDASGNIYVAGVTESTDNIATAGAHQSTHPGSGEVGMLARISPTCVREWATYCGAAPITELGVAVSGSNVAICGTATAATSIATADALQTAPAGNGDGFAVLFTTTGARSYGTYYGGSEYDDFDGVMFIAGGSSAGDMVFCGTSNSDGLGVGNVHQVTRAALGDGFLACLRNVSITVGTIAQTNLCKGTALAVPYTASGTFASTNIFRAELSDNTGSFETNSNIGLRMSPGSGTINGAVPSLPPSTGGYKIRVASSNPRGYSLPLSTTYILHPSDTGRHTWTGAVSSAWNTAGNWVNPCAIPSTDDSVTVSAGPHAPVTPTTPLSLRYLRTNATGGVTLGADLTITQYLLLDRGPITLGAYNLTMAAGAIIPDAGDSAHVVTNGTGEMRSRGETHGGYQVATFPIGATFGSPSECTVRNSGTPDEFRARVVAGVTSNGLPGGTPITSDVVSRTWHISEATAGGSAFNLELYWRTPQETGTFDRTRCFIGRIVGGAWQRIGPDTVAAIISIFAHTGRDGQTVLGTYAIGDQQSVIPVELVLFTARVEGTDVVLAWETADERANAGFEVQRARVDDDAWTVVAFVAARAAEGSGARYEAVDRSVAAGTWRYRLRQVDVGGRAEVSQTVTVVVGDESAVPLVAVHPNPARDVAQVVVRDARVVVLRDVLGREVWRSEVADSGVQTLVVPTQFMPAGVYIVETELARTLLRIVR